MSASNSQRVYSLDILKMMAICIIVLHHYQQVVGVQFSSGINWYHGSFYWGNLVELFFIISGFLTYRYVDRIDASSHLSGFFIKKYLRFLPLLVVGGIGYLLVNLFYRTYFNSGGFPFSLWTVLSSLLGVSRWFDTSHMVNNPMWYISVLLLCFVWFFAAVKCSKKIGFSPLAVFVGIIAFGLIMNYISVVHQIAFPFFNESISRGLVAFFTGVVLCKPLHVLDEKLGNRLFWMSLVVVVAFVLLYAFKKAWITKGSFSLAYTLYFVIFPSVVVFFYSRPMQQLFSSSFWRNIGGIAYGMYVWHTPLIYVYIIAAAMLGVSIESRVGMWVFLAISFAVGYLCQKFLEPVLNRKVTAMAMDFGLLPA